MTAVGHSGNTMTASEREWLRVRAHLRDNRYDLAQAAADAYPDDWKVTGTPLLAPRSWMPTTPLPLDRIALESEPDAEFAGLTGSASLTESVRPVRADGIRYNSYATAMGELAAPSVFENRSTYRLLSADFSVSGGRLRFGRGSYFDSINVGEAAAHEHAAAQLDGQRTEPLRTAVGAPFDPARRPINVAISTLTIRHDPRTGDARFLLHWRDPAKVGHAGGLYQVLPVGIFQASDDKPWNESNDFSPWRCMIREYAEELLGESEEHGSEQERIDYETWPFAARMTQGLDSGRIRPYCLGLGVDPLTFATDLLSVVVFDAPLFDELFGGLVTRNDEGQLVDSPAAGSPSRGFPFTGEEVDRLSQDEPMQAAGAALLRLAWQHSPTLLA